MNNPKRNNFSLLHILSAFLVILGHCFPLTGNNMLLFLGTSVHQIGFEMLFFISGFLVSLSELNKEIKLFKELCSRLLRFIIPLLVVLLLTIAIFSAITTTDQSTYWSGATTYLWKNASIVFDCFYLPGCLVDSPFPQSVNGSLWSLKCSVIGSLVIILLIYIFKKIKNKKIPLVLAILITISLLCCAILYEYNLEYNFMPQDLLKQSRPYYYMSAGVLLSLFFKDFKFSKKYFTLTSTIIFIFVTIFLSFFTPIPRYFLIPYLVISFAYSKPILNDFFNKYDCVYGLYLFSFPATQLIEHLNIHYCNNSMNIFIVMLLTILVVIPLALLLKFYVEKPLNKLSRCILQI